VILVTGATGKVGSAAVRELRSRGVPVRALVRDPDRARPLARLGAELAVGDFAEPATLDGAMAGVDTLVLVGPGGPPEQELAAVAAAVRAGVGHVVKLTSQASPDSPIARQRWHAEVERGLAASGLAHTLLRSNAFMQNLLMLAPGIARTGGFASSAGAGRIGMVDARDVGAVAAAVAADPARHAARTYRLTGPQLVSYGDVAGVLSDVLGRTVTFRARSREEDRAEMVRAGLPAEVAGMNALAVSLFADGDAEWLSPDVPELLGCPARSLRQFTEDNAAAFS